MKATSGKTAASASSVVRLRPAVRASLIVFVLVECAVLIPICVVASVDDVPLVAVIAALMLAGVVAFTYRMIRVSMIFSPDELVVRNFFRTRQVARTDVEKIQMGAITDWPFRGNITLLLRDGAVLPLDIAGRRLPLTGRGRAVVDERRRRLQSWIGDRQSCR